MNRISIIFILIASVFIINRAEGQIELVPVEHPVYEFLKKMQVEGVIPEYSSANLPLSRKAVGNYIDKILNSRTLSGIESKLAKEFYNEFYYDVRKDPSRYTSIFGTKRGNLFSDEKFRYLYGFTDTNASLFFNTIVEFEISGNEGDSLLNNTATISDLGLIARGTLYDKVGYSINIQAGKKVAGTSESSEFLKMTNTTLKTDREFRLHGNYYTNYRGHARYQTPGGFLSLTAGHEKISIGSGYISKLFYSNDAPPFSFIKLDLSYKKFAYSFFYGSLRGDSIGVELNSKNIAGHRLDVNFSDKFRAGFYESIVISNDPFSFSFFNPFSFLTSADLNSGAKETTLNNTLMGIDLEYVPFKNLSIQATFLIDDLNLSTISDTSYVGNENKFGYQLGILWSRAFTLDNLILKVEYTRLDPFVYSHRSNKSTYTNWGISLGSQLPPNSDEIALETDLWLSSRININCNYTFQRSAFGIIFDENGKLLYNFGGDINYGFGDYNIIKNRFLNGNRINKSFFTLNLNAQLFRQFYLNVMYRYSYFDLLYKNGNNCDNTFKFGIKFHI